MLVLTLSHPEALRADLAALKLMNPNEALTFSDLGQEACGAIESLPSLVMDGRLKLL